MSSDGRATGGGDEVGDRREKHVSVLTRSGDRFEHGDAYFRHSATHFVVCPEASFPEAETERYDKETLLRVEVTQHHGACFITTATAGDPDVLDALRGFRDDAMGRSPVGRVLIGLYYAVSPPVADTLARHPRSRTARTVRRFVEGCADLAGWRSTSRSRAVRVVASTLLTIAYAVGLAIAIVGHGCIRVREFVEGEAGPSVDGTARVRSDVSDDDPPSVGGRREGR